MLARREVRRGAGTVGDVGVAGRVDHHLAHDRLAARLGLHDDPRHPVALHDGRDEAAVQHGMDAGLLDQPVGDELEALAVDLVAE